MQAKDWQPAIVFKICSPPEKSTFNISISCKYVFWLNNIQIHCTIVKYLRSNSSFLYESLIKAV